MLDGPYSNVSIEISSSFFVFLFEAFNNDNADGLLQSFYEVPWRCLAFTTADVNLPSLTGWIVTANNLTALRLVM